MKKEISNEETRRHVQRAVDLFFNSLPKAGIPGNCIEQTDLAEAVAKLDRIAERDAKGSVVETPRPTYKEELESCTKCELDARGHYMKELKHDCGKQEPKSEENEFTQILRDAKDWDSKEDPKSTLRENGTRIVYEYLRSSGITFNTIDSREIADKIISLFKDTLLKELPLLKVERWTTTGAPFVSEENIAHNNVIKNIKDIIKNL